MAVKKSKTVVTILAIVGIVIGLIMVLGILAANTIPSFLGLSGKGSNAMAHAEIKNACIRATDFFATPGYDSNGGQFKTEGGVP